MAMLLWQCADNSIVIGCSSSRFVCCNPEAQGNVNWRHSFQHSFQLSTASAGRRILTNTKNRKRLTNTKNRKRLSLFANTFRPLQANLPTHRCVPGKTFRFRANDPIRSCCLSPWCELLPSSQAIISLSGCTWLTD